MMQAAVKRTKATWEEPRPARNALNWTSKGIWHAAEAAVRAFSPSAAVSRSLGQLSFATSSVIRPAIRGFELIEEVKKTSTDLSQKQWMTSLEALPSIVFKSAVVIGSLAGLAHWLRPFPFAGQLSTQAFGVARLTLPALWVTQLKQLAWNPVRSKSGNNHRELVRLGADMFSDGAIYFGLTFVSGGSNLVIAHLIGMGSVALNLYAAWPAVRDQK